MKQEEKLQLLRELLLIEDRQVAEAITNRLNTLSETLEKKQNLAEKVNPIIKEQLQEFVTKIPETLGPTITKTLKEEIANSKDQVVEALYPIMGKMIKRYIQNEIKMLSENINQKVNNTFSFQSIKRKFRSKFSGVKESDLIIADAHKPNINEIFIIEKGSGVLLGNYSTSNTIDKEMISGMLTAIKSFVEDAFSGEVQNLESIEYELYTIHIQNYYNYYIAVVLSGNYSQNFENILEDKLLQFSEKITEKIEQLSQDKVNLALKEFAEEINQH